MKTQEFKPWIILAFTAQDSIERTKVSRNSIGHQTLISDIYSAWTEVMK